MKTLDDAVVEQQGKWFDNDFGVAFAMKSDMKTIVLDNVSYDSTELAFFCTRNQFQQRAKELGFINGYRYGVKYPTNGKKPDLADDVKIWVKSPVGSGYIHCHSFYDAPDTHTFKITDQRYKPQDTSYLDKPDSPLDKKESSLDSTADWFDYEAQKAVALPKAGEYCQVYLNGWYNCYIVGLDDLGGCVFRKDGEYMQRITDESFRPLDWNRKAEAEKKRVVDAIKANLRDFDIPAEAYGLLYDAGYLRLPTNKD